jgi:glutamine amidotransferase
VITIVDYGMGNLGSVLNMFKRIGADALIASTHDEIRDAEKLLLPGVGAFDAAMARIRQSGLDRILEQKVKTERTPILGICLGMQLLVDSSEEGELPGLGWVAGTARRFPIKQGLKVPHMGWNVVMPTRVSPLTRDLPEESRFYFVHSYYICVDHPEDSVLQATHGLTFDAAIQSDNIYGAQFHPEKSHKFGMQLLRNFADL